MCVCVCVCIPFPTTGVITILSLALFLIFIFSPSKMAEATDTNFIFPRLHYYLPVCVCVCDGEEGMKWAALVRVFLGVRSVRLAASCSLPLVPSSPVTPSLHCQLHMVANLPNLFTPFSFLHQRLFAHGDHILVLLV